MDNIVLKAIRQAIATGKSVECNIASGRIDIHHAPEGETIDADFTPISQQQSCQGRHTAEAVGGIAQVTGRQSTMYRPDHPALPVRRTQDYYYYYPRPNPHPGDEAFQWFRHRSEWGASQIAEQPTSCTGTHGSQEKARKSSSTKAASQQSLSAACNEVLGPNNIQNCTGLEDALLLQDIFTALVERAAIEDARHPDSRLRKLMEVHNPVRATAEIRDEVLHWSVNSITDTGFVAYFVALFSLSRRDAECRLADYLGLKIENLFQMSSTPHAAETHIFSPIENFPTYLRLDGYPNAQAIRFRKMDILGNSGQVIGAVLWCNLGNGLDCLLPATVGKGELCIGKYKPTAFWLNQDQLNKFPDAPVILFQDARTAMKLLEELHGCQRYTDGKVIITAHLGSDLSVLRWGYLYRHHVIFVPAPRLSGMMMAKDYERYAVGAGARTFTVYPGVVLHDRLACNLYDYLEALPEGEKALLEKAVIIDDIERPIRFCEEIIKRALPYDTYAEWGQELGFFKKDIDTARSINTKSKDAFAYFTLENCTKQEMPINIKDITLYHILPQTSSIVLHGLKDSGKSMVVLAAVKHLLENGEKVLVFDTETLPAVLENRLYKMGLDLYVQSGTLRIVQKTVQGCNFDFLDDSMHEQIFKATSQDGITYVVFDNLTSGISNGCMYAASMMAKFHSLEENLHKHNIATIVVTHSKDNSKACTSSAVMRGSQEGSVRAHTELIVIDHRHIVGKKLGPEHVQKVAAQQEGLTLGVILKACKAAPILTGKTFWLHLPLVSSDWQLIAVTNPDGEEIPLENKQIPVAEGDEQGSTEEAKGMEVAYEEGLAESHSGTEVIPHNLSPDKRKILHVMREDGGSITREGVEKALGCKKDKALNELNQLKELGLVQRDGNSKGAYYTLTSPE
ncbi:MAG: AAA family ATPase [Desulfovibrio sp.]|nr:AAA family ATPase [Desulfovibrio sp.]